MVRKTPYASVILVFSLSACGSPEQTLSVVGGVIGGVAAASVTGDVRYIAAGVGGGAVAGFLIGRGLSSRHKEMHEVAARSAHSTGMYRVWSDPNEGLVGEIIPLDHSFASRPGCNAARSVIKRHGQIVEDTNFQGCIDQNGRYYTMAAQA